MLRGAGIIGCLVLLLRSASAAAPTCGADSLCPAETPCCSLYGECGVGAYCLGGCDPIFSYSLNSCAASPTCQSGNFAMNTLDDVQPNTQYLGNSTSVNWVSEGEPLVYANDSMLLTMAQGSIGTLLTSTHYVWYGKVSVTMQSSAGAGVVTAFILQSDVRDELDFEFVGADLQHVQSNYYWQGVLNWTNSANLSAPSSNTETHTYTFDWTPESVSWLVDGNNLRTVYAKDTYNSTTQQYQYPQTPARIMLSLWPAGNPGNAQGTIDWAGGDISWTSPYMTNGYYYAQIMDVEVECYGPYSGANTSGTNGYTYNNYDGLNSSVAVTDDNTILSSFYATGENEDFNPFSSTATSATSSPTSTNTNTDSTSSTTSSVALATESVNTVPGQIGGGVKGDSSGSSGNSTDSASSATSTAGSYGGFSQGLVQHGTAAAMNSEGVLGGGAFALMVAVGFVLVL